MTKHIYTIGQKNNKGKAMCGSKRSSYPRNQKPCAGTILYSNGRCRYHGGPSKSGKQNGNYKHGRHVKTGMPKHILDRVESMLDNNDLLDQTPQIAAMLAQLPDLWGQLSNEGMVTLWGQLKADVGKLGVAVRAGDGQGVYNAHKALDTLATAGASDADTWKAIHGLFHSANKLVTTQQKYQADQEQSVQYSTIIIMLDNIKRDTEFAIQKHTDGETARAILADVARAHDKRLTA